MINSPCVGLCVCDENDVCIGCKRSLDEISSWTRLSDDEKLICIKNSESRKKFT